VSEGGGSNGGGGGDAGSGGGENGFQGRLVTPGAGALTIQDLINQPGLLAQLTAAMGGVGGGGSVQIVGQQFGGGGSVLGGGTVFNNGGNQVG